MSLFFVGYLIKIKLLLNDIETMGVIIFFSILLLSVGFASFQYTKAIQAQNTIIAQRREKRETRLKEEEKQKVHDNLSYLKHIATNDIVKKVDESHSSFSVEIDEEYKHLFVEYIHRFKDFAKIKGFSSNIEFISPQDPKIISCRFTLTPSKKRKNQLSSEELFKRYLSNYPVFA